MYETLGELERGVLCGSQACVEGIEGHAEGRKGLQLATVFISFIYLSPASPLGYGTPCPSHPFPTPCLYR